MNIKHALLHAAACLTEHVAENLEEATVIEMDDFDIDLHAANVLVDYARELDPQPEAVEDLIDRVWVEAFTR